MKDNSIMANNISMKILLIGVIMLFIVISVEFVSAATIHGTIYDALLMPENNITLRIDSIPPQFIVSKDGNYEFQISPGTYTMNAKTIDSFANENITVIDDGDYVIDIILQQAISEPLDYQNNLQVDDSLLDLQTNNQSNTSKNKINTTNIFIQIVMLIVLVVLLVLFFNQKFRNTKKSKKLNESKEYNESKENNISKNILNSQSEKFNSERDELSNTKLGVDEYSKKVLDIIEKEKRTTQKDLRKNIPLSESKISLIITELESIGKIKKIKKGRGNILLFVKK